MRTITFFTAKGGTGKSSFNMLLCSWLKYLKGRRVLAIDFDAPEYNLSTTRERELDYLQRSGKDPGELYPIERMEVMSVRELRDFAARIPALEPLYDYVILDFKGSFLETDAVFQMVVAGRIDLVVIPIEMDGMSISSCYSLGSIFNELGQRMLVFFNRVHGREKPELYERFRELFASGKIPMSNHRIKNTVKMRRDSDSENNFIRSSVGFPLKEITAVNPEIVELFEEVIAYVEKETKGSAHGR